MALRLRELELPASFVGSALYVLRAFKKSIKATLPQFQLPESLRKPKAPELRVIVGDGQKLFFSLRAGQLPPIVFGGVDLQKLRASKKSIATLEHELAQTAEVGGGIEYDRVRKLSAHARLEASITAIAKDLKLST